MFCVFGIYGRYLTITQTFQRVDMLGNRTWLPFDQLFSNYEAFLNQLFSEGSLVLTSIKNSLKTYLISFLITNPLYFFFAFFIYKKTVGTRFFSLVILLPEIISALIFSLVFKKIIEGPLIEVMEFLGYRDFPNLLATNQYAYGITLFYMIWVSFGQSCIVYSNAMTSIDPGIVESSKIDGVDNMFQEIWYIMLPLVYPTFSTFFIISLTTIFATDAGLVTFYMYGAPPEAYNLGYYMIVKVFNSNSIGYPVIGAGGMMLTLILIPIVFTIKHFVEKIDPTN